MSLVNTMLAVIVLVVTSKAVVMGAKSGPDPQVIIDVLNTYAGATSASCNNLPRRARSTTALSGG